MINDSVNLNDGAQPKAKVTAKDFAAKMRDKQEVYHFLTHEVGAYLSSYDTMTVWHMRDLMTGTRLRILGKHVNHLNVPQYDGLKIEKFLEFAQDHPKVLRALPSEKKEILKLPRK